MILETSTGIPLSSDILSNYLQALINQFFKILPIWESKESTIDTYIRSLQSELMGCKELIIAINNDAQFLSLIAILQYLIDNPECENHVVKREVFRSISIINKLKSKYSSAAEVK